MPTDPLTITVLDLDAALGGNADLLIGGGFGLYLKQLHLDSLMRERCCRDHDGRERERHRTSTCFFARRSSSMLSEWPAIARQSINSA